MLYQPHKNLDIFEKEANLALIERRFRHGSQFPPD